MTVDLANDAFTVSYDDSRVFPELMLTTIEALGYEPSLLQSRLPNVHFTSERDLPKRVRLLVNRSIPIAIYFGAPWCGACKIMERTTFIDPKVMLALTKFKYLKVDVEEDTETGTAFSISAVPTFVVLDAEGHEVYRHVGPLTASEMRLVLGEFENAPT